MEKLTYSMIQDLQDCVTSSEEKVWLVLRTGIVEVNNLHPEPKSNFKIDPYHLVKHSEDLIGTVHSHTEGSANLSVNDYSSFKNWKKMLHFIVTNTEIRAYYSDGEAVFNASNSEITRFFEGSLF